MKVNFKRAGIEAEADVEKIIEKGMDNHENNWQEKHKAKKEILELKHKHKMEELNATNSNRINKEIELEKDKIRLEYEKLNSQKSRLKPKNTNKSN